MTPYPRLNRAPIREAVVDLRVRLPDDQVEERMRAFSATLLDRYPRQRPIHQFHGQIRFDDGGITAQEQLASRYGYRVESADGKCVVQIRRDGFTFSRLPPYESWDAMVNEAWAAWEQYVNGLEPFGVSRVATRFINVIGVVPGEPLDRVLAEPPRLPDGLPVHLTHFLFRYVTQATEGIASSVSLATEEGSDPPSLVLDIDCFAKRDFSVRGGGMEAIRNVLERLRERKNAVFFNTVSSNAVEGWK